ncbi:pentapeptide repeat-containing protein [Nostoc sp.]|uniref:pentapeptide repeat-containing protein n=1 Tax=Nostoc sp. TaxID=1180 RepID=UPI002FF513CE
MMNKPTSVEKLAELFQVIHNHPNAKLSELAQKVGLDLTKDYIGADFSGEDLSEDNLKYANFSDADLSNANLSHTDLSVANLIDVNLTEANLTNANLSGTDLTGANLINAKLSGANLIGSDLINAKLSGADLTKVNLINAKLSGADLTNANLINACLRGADLSGANLENSNLSNANLIDANFTGANLSNANLKGANLENSNLSNANLIDANFTDANLSNANLKNIDLSDINQINLVYKSQNSINNSLKIFEELIKADKKIISAASELDSSEIIFNDICKKIEEQFEFDFISISLVMPEQNTIETVYGTGIATKWVDRARHPIQENEKLRDIQADIVKTGQTEIISGWDDRFDRGIYDRFGHDKVIRIFTPIFLFYDEKKHLIEDWFNSYKWEENFIQKQQDGRVLYMEERPSNAKDRVVIGTLEAGYQNLDRSITFEQARSLAKLVAEQALNIRRISLRYVLETIVESARSFFNANLATLHFLWNPQQEQEGKYIYEVFKGDIGAKALDEHEFSPRKNGLGRRAIDEKEVKVISYSQKNCNISFSEKAHLRGFKVYAAFPLLINTTYENIPRSISTINQQEQLNTIVTGVLYVHFREESEFTEELQRLGNNFVNTAVHAITTVIKYQKVREKARQLSALQHITQSFNEIDKNLINYIAWNTLNILAAGVVIIYEFIQPEKKLQTPPTFAGKFLDEEKMRTETIDDDTIILSLINGGKNVYPDQDYGEPLLKNLPFAQREEIKSAAGILLKANNDIIVGVMFINYRRIHSFSNEEKQIIDSLASSAATAIHNYRWMQSLNNIERKIINQETLKLVVKKAVQITGANVGEIIIESNTKESITLGYPNRQLSKSVASWEEVKTYGESKLVNKIKDQQNYKPYFHDSNSELSVPLLDENYYLRGVLIVGSNEDKEFTEINLLKLKYIANLALIAIQYAEKEKTVQQETIATIDHLSMKLVSQINNDKDNSYQFSQNEDDKSLKQKLTLANDVKENISSLNNDVKETINNLNKDNVETSQVQIKDSFSKLNKEGKILLNSHC